jgi:N-methylhydantoinase B/oxoprolinase/acetone carboxylase alpha subunit
VQVSANQKGIRLMQELIDTYGLDVVVAYMHHSAVLFCRRVRRTTHRCAVTGQSVATRRRPCVVCFEVWLSDTIWRMGVYCRLAITWFGGGAQTRMIESWC